MEQPLSSVSSFASPWDQLQQRLRPTQMNERFLLLLAALEGGWQIEAVQAFTRSTGEASYQFMLSREPLNSRRELTVPSCAEVLRFLRDENLQIIQVS